MSKAAIVTSVYNKAPWLDRCFNSFVNQTFSDLEFIVINNGSTDESATIIDKFAKQDQRFRVITLKDNIGPSGADALGINEVSSEFFTICDCDDYLDTNYIEVLLNKIEDNNADISMCTNDMVFDDGRTVINKRPPKNEIIFTTKDVENLLPQLIDHHSNLYLGYYLAEIGVAWGKLYKTSFVRESNVNYDPEVWIFSDWLFNYMLLKHMNKMVYTEDTSYHFYQSDGSVTRSKIMNWNEFSRRKIVLDKFSTICDGVKGKAVIALVRFYTDNIFSLLAMYVRHYSSDVSKSELRKALNQISNWPQFKFIFIKKMIGLSFKQMIVLFLIKKKIIFPFILRARIRNLLKK